MGADFKRLFEIFFKPGEVCEIRALGVHGKGHWEGYAKETVSGYYSDPAKLTADLKALDSARAEGVYFCLNPAIPALLARAENRLIVPKATTTDEQVTCHRWLLIDCDSKRPAGISSTDGECEQALETASRIAYYLQENSFPEPISANSGNGAHLLYRLPDLPNSKEITDLKRDVLKALASLYDNHSVGIDQVVFNASRITKAYGTWARKGDNTTDRPHRPSSLESVPNPIIPVTLEQLQWLAAQAPREDKPNPQRSERVSNLGNLGPLDVQSYLGHYGIEIIRTKDGGPGRIYGLRHCIFNPEHAGNEAAIIQKSDGMLTYQCFHNSCQGRTWAEARTIISGSDNLAPFCQGYDPNTTRPVDKPKANFVPTSGTIREITARLRNTIDLNRKRGRIGEKTGFQFLDNTIHGFLKSLLYVVGAYTSSGKTAFMVQLACNALSINPKIRIAIFSLEMSKDSILLRLVSNKTEISSLSILEGFLDPHSQQKVDAAFECFENTELRLFDDLYTVPEIAAACRAIGPLDVCFVDFIQNIRAEGSIYDRMSVVPVELQKLAKELNTCIVAMSQVSNEAVKYDSQLIGFKGAGEIAAACDLGLWLERDKKDKYLILCSIRKNRHGPTGKKQLRFSENFTRIIED